MRLQLPLLNLHVRNLVNEKGVLVVNFGTARASNYPAINLGVSRAVTNTFLKGKHSVSRIAAKAFHMVGCTENIIENLVMLGVMLKSPLVVKQITTFTGLLNMKEIGWELVPGALARNVFPDCVFFLNADDLDVLARYAVFFGSHGDKQANNAMAILPVPAFIESAGSFVSMWGKVVKQTPVALQTPFWAYFSALDRHFALYTHKRGYWLPGFGLNIAALRLDRWWSKLPVNLPEYTAQVLHVVFPQLIITSVCNIVNNSLFDDLIYNSYKTHAVYRVSHNLALANYRFAVCEKNFK